MSSLDRPLTFVYLELKDWNGLGTEIGNKGTARYRSVCDFIEPSKTS